MPRNGASALPPGLSIGAWAPSAWRAPLQRLIAVWLSLAALFFADWAAMAGQWWNSSTYNHVLLIPAILAWLVYQRVPQLAKLEPDGWWPGLAVFAGAVLIWVLGAFAGLAMAREFGAAAMLIGSALAILGPRAGAGLAFPLGYMLFLVPFGDELVPPLQMVTAALTVALVHLSGIRASIDGVFINTPAGLFEVAEACSGVKFLIAMIAFGVLAAQVCFLSWRRRIAFLLLSVVIPVLANGVRAWGTVYAAQFVGAARAGGIDHIVYGWVFFAVVIAMILALAWRFFDRPFDDPMVDAAAINASPMFERLAAMRISAAPLLMGLAILAMGGQAWAFAADSLAAPVPRQIYLPEVPGWHRADYAPRAWWEPRASGAEHRVLGRYVDGKGHEADVFFAYYSTQGEGRKAGGFGEGALRPGSGWAWQSPGPGTANAKSDRLLGAGRTARLAETYYRNGSLLTGSNARLKLANMQDRLLLRSRPTLLLILSAEEHPGQPAAETIDAFRRAAGSTGQWMDRIAGLR